MAKTLIKGGTVITATETMKADVLIEDQTPLGGLYLTMITISTVGFAEPDGGFGAGGQIFTVFLILVGVGAVFYTAVGGLELMVEEVMGGAGRLRRVGPSRFKVRFGHGAR